MADRDGQGREALAKLLAEHEWVPASNFLTGRCRCQDERLREAMSVGVHRVHLIDVLTDWLKAHDAEVAAAALREAADAWHPHRFDANLKGTGAVTDTPSTVDTFYEGARRAEKFLRARTKKGVAL